MPPVVYYLLREMEGESYVGAPYPNYSVPVTPPGLQAIYNACRRLYPDQLNPLQVTALVKYWLGGPDPLDYISMHVHPGDPGKGVPPHWHYVSFGLSDLHGDGRVHECSGAEGASGFGFELTFRLKRETGETAPPTWPAALMQALARYVFQSDNTLCAGDHIPWHSPLDASESRIQHMLMTEDPQLQPVMTPLGTVSFIQIVGVCQEELKAAQYWNGTGVVELLKTVPIAGGPWLITDMRRGETIFEADPMLQEQVDQGINMEGSNLSGVTSKCSWEEPRDCHTCHRDNDHDEDKENRLQECDRSSREEGGWSRQRLSHSDSEKIKAVFKKGLINARPVLPPIKSEPADNRNCTHTDQNQNNSRKQSFDDSCSEAPTELLRTRTLECVHLRFNLEAGALLPLALKGRLKHGRHFTFKSVVSDAAITFVSSSVVGSIADEEHPFAAHGLWLQVLLMDDFITRMVTDMSELEEPESFLTAKTYSWPDKKLKITVCPDEL